MILMKISRIVKLNTLKTIKYKNTYDNDKNQYYTVDINND